MSLLTGRVNRPRTARRFSALSAAKEQRTVLGNVYGAPNGGIVNTGAKARNCKSTKATSSTASLVLGQNIVILGRPDGKDCSP